MADAAVEKVARMLDRWRIKALLTANIEDKLKTGRLAYT